METVFFSSPRLALSDLTPESTIQPSFPSGYTAIISQLNGVCQANVSLAVSGVKVPNELSLRKTERIRKEKLLRIRVSRTMLLKRFSGVAKKRSLAKLRYDCESRLYHREREVG